MPFGSTTIGGDNDTEDETPVDPTPTEGSTVDDLVQATMRHLNGMHRAEWNKLASDLTSNAETLTANYALQGISTGSYISIDDEICYVWTTDPATKAVTLQRGMLGSVADSHVEGSLIEVNPRFPRYAVIEAIRDEIRSWYPQLYQVRGLTFSVTATQISIDLDGIDENMLHVIDVQRVPTTTDGHYARVAYRVDRHADEDSFTSGLVIHLDQAPGETTSYRVVFAESFTLDTFLSTTYLVDDIGLAESMFDIAPLGAAWRLLATREVKRTFTEGQGEPRNSGEVPPGHILQAATGLKQLRDQRLGEEARRLALRYPPKSLR